MTTYTAIPDSDIDPESPVTTTLMTRLRDNPLAVIEGDATAPDIEYSALTAPSIVAGTTYNYHYLASGTTGATSMTKVSEMLIAVKGTVNVYLGVKVSYFLSGPNGTAYAQIYVNGSPVGTLRSTTSETYVYFSENITIDTGDLIQIYARHSSGGFDYSSSDATLRTDTLLPWMSRNNTV